MQGCVHAVACAASLILQLAWLLLAVRVGPGVQSSVLLVRSHEGGEVKHVVKVCA